MRCGFAKKVIKKSQRQFMYGSNFYGSDVMFFDLVFFFASNQTYKIKCVKDMQNSSVYIVKNKEMGYV